MKWVTETEYTWEQIQWLNYEKSSKWTSSDNDWYIKKREYQPKKASWKRVYAGTNEIFKGGIVLVTTVQRVNLRNFFVQLLVIISIIWFHWK